MLGIGKLLNRIGIGSGKKQPIKPPLSTGGQTETTVSPADTDRLRTELNEGHRAKNALGLNPLGAPIFDEPTEDSQGPNNLVPLTDRTLTVIPDEKTS